MTIRDIFVPLFPGVGFSSQLEVAADLALRFKAHVNVVFTRPDPITAAAAFPEMIAATGLVSEAIEKGAKLAQAAALLEFNRWRTAYGLAAPADEAAESSIAAAWHDRVGIVERTVTDVGRVSDLIVVAKPDSFEAVTQGAFSAALFDTGRPTLVTPAKVPQYLLNHVIIAWNGGLEAARAVHGAMPMLRHAERVSIFSASAAAGAMMHELGLIEHLSWHGVDARYLSPDGKAGDVGRALLETAAEKHATMIVMGAYSHSRVREAVLGGVTRHVLRHAEIPVLMMH